MSQARLSQVSATNSTPEFTNTDPNTVVIPLSNNKELLQQLHNFRKICTCHNKKRKRVCRKRYLQLGIVARVTEETTFSDLLKLLNNGALTFLFDSVALPPKKLNELVDLTNSAIEVYQGQEHKKHVMTGLAFEILGDCCRLGRMRNDCSAMLCSGDIFTLTTDKAYELSGYKEVCYVKNLDYFLMNLKLRDSLKIGKEAKGCVVKKLIASVVVHINKPGLINSYDYLALPNQCQVRTDDVVDMVNEDLKMVKELGGQYVVLQQVRCKQFLKLLRDYMTSNFIALELIGSIDFEYIGAKKIDLCSIIEILDKLWVKDYFDAPCLLRAHILGYVVPRAKYFHKPIIASVPLKARYEYPGYLNHPFLWFADSMFIEKSYLCLKYPLIVRQLLRVQESCTGDEKQVPINNLPQDYESRIRFILKYINPSGCRAIFVNIACEAVKSALRCIDTTKCPIYVMLPFDRTDESELQCMLDLARSLNFRRNMRPILYTSDMNIKSYTPLEYGIDYTRSKGCIKTCDYIITVELISDNSGKEDAEDVIKLRAFFLR